MTKKAQQKHQDIGMSALIQYIWQTEQSFARSIAQAETPEERRVKQLDRKVMLWEVEIARKYKLTPSALAMIARLKPSQSSIIEELPGTGVWMRLDDEKDTNVYFSSVPLAYSAYRNLHPEVRLSAAQRKVAERNQWDLEIMALNSHVLLYLYDANRQRWTLSNAHICYAQRCERISTDPADGFPFWYICDECMPTFQYWTSWLPVALMAINGNFAEREERQEPAIFRERETRTKRTERGPKEVTVTHEYQIITFDISVKKSVTPLEGEERGEPEHPTWLERGLHDETILYVDKHIASTTRTFRHQRYVNMRGKTIDVAAYDKRVPMSLKRLQTTIYQAIASHP
jgi:hypothetical protein